MSDRTDPLPEAAMLYLFADYLTALEQRTRSASYSADTPGAARELTRLEVELMHAHEAVTAALAVALIYCESPATREAHAQRKPYSLAALRSLGDRFGRAAAVLAEAAVALEPFLDPEPEPEPTGEHGWTDGEIAAALADGDAEEAATPAGEGV